MSIYSYIDFRLFVQDRISILRSENPNLSIREILRRVECSSPSYYREVILDAKKRMSMTIARRFAAFFSLTTDETEFFLLLVQYNQATAELDKLHFYEKLLALKKNPVTENHILNVKEYGYMTEWHHVIIRELLPLITNFGNRDKHERQELAQKLRVKLTDDQINTAIQVLESLKFIRKNSEGNYEKTEMAIRLDKKSPAAHATLCQFMDLAKSAIATTESGSRMAKMAVIGMNSEAFAIIERKINEAFQEIVEIAGTAGTSPDRLYALNLQLFPLTRLPDETV